MHRSKIPYRFTCNVCNSIYLGKKYIFLLELMSMWVYMYAQEINIRTIPGMAITLPNCHGKLDDFDIIGKADNDFFLRIKESLLIKKFKPTLNLKGKSIPSHLFD